MTTLPRICFPALFISSALAVPEPAALFNGQSLEGWQGTPGIWRVEDGAITGEIKDGASLNRNEWIYWQGEVKDFGVGGIGRLLKLLLTKAPLIGSILFLAISFYAFLALLAVADLSFAVPATALSLVAETVLARVLLKERVTAARWGGTVLVALGVALLAI